jgi:hypothetical protein
MLAAMYVCDALLVAAFGACDHANERYQWVWLAADTSLAGSLFAALFTSLKPVSRLRVQSSIQQIETTSFA